MKEEEQIKLKKENKILKQKIEFVTAIANEINKSTACGVSKTLSSQLLYILNPNGK